LPIENYVLDNFVSGVILPFLFCHSFAVPLLTPLHKLRASAQTASERLFFVILTLSEAKGKNLHMRPFLRLRVTG